jgi:hypothetical protein
MTDSAGQPGDPAPETAMGSGSDAGTPGESPAGPPQDPVAAAVADDAPLPPGTPGAGEGGDQGDGLAPDFREPTPAE